MYVISYEVTGLTLSIILMIAQVFFFDRKERTNRIFHWYTGIVMFECALDILTAKGIDGAFHMSDGLSIFVNTVYFLLSLASAFVGYILVSIRLGYKKKIINGIALGLLGISEATMIINAFSGEIFTFVDGIYVKTSVFPIYYVFCFAFLLLIIPVMIIQRNELNKRELFAPISFIAILIFAFILQLIFPESLLSGEAKAIAAMVFCMFLETPEHIKLQSVIKEVEVARDEERLAVQAFEEANNQKNNFLIQMSHNLRTPVNAIMGFDEMLLRECQDPVMRTDALELRHSGDRLMDLVDELVDYSQIELGELELRPEEYDFAYAYMVMHSRAERIMKGTNLQFENHVDKNLPQCLYGDMKRICQIIEKVLLFVRHQMQHGILRLNVDVDHVEDNQIFISYSVYSSGVFPTKIVDSDNYEYIMMHRILTSVGSELHIYNEEGTVFQFVLQQEIVDLKPIGEIKAAIRAFVERENKAETVKHFVMPKARILAVDDTSVNLKVLEGLLKPYKVQFTKAMSGFHALDIMKEEEFDLVFMDIMMPGMDGIEALSKIRTEEGILSKDVQVIALTANVFFGARAKYLADGFADYITKPIDGPKIATTLIKFLPELLEDDYAELEVTQEQEDFPQKQQPEGKKKYAGFLTGKKTEDAGNKKYTGFLGGAKKKEVKETMPSAAADLGIEGFSMKDGLSLCMGDMDLYKDVVKDYCNNHVDVKLREFYQAKDWENYRIYIHGAKSTSKTIGLNALADAALALEMAAKEFDIEFIDSHHDKWLSDYQKAVETLPTLL